MAGSAAASWLPTVRPAPPRAVRWLRWRIPSRSGRTCTSSVALERSPICKGAGRRRRRAVLGQPRKWPQCRLARWTTLRSARKTSCSTSAGVARRIRGFACRTTSRLLGRARQCLRMASRNARLARFLTTAFPTLRVTVRPTRAGLTALAFRANTVSKPLPARTPPS